MTERLCVVLTDSLEDGGRKAAIGLGVALAALSHGAEVHVFLSLESARLGTPTGSDGFKPRGFNHSLNEYLQLFGEMGGKLEVCSSCFEEYCRDLPQGADGRPLLRSGTSVHSLGIVAERATSMSVVTF